LRGTQQQRLCVDIQSNSDVLRGYRQAHGEQYGKYSASYAAECVRRTANSLLCQTLLADTHVPVGKAEACYNRPLTVGEDRCSICSQSMYALESTGRV
jgi:hypothetical protein